MGSRDNASASHAGARSQAEPVMLGRTLIDAGESNMPWWQEPGPRATQPPRAEETKRCRKTTSRRPTSKCTAVSKKRKIRAGTDAGDNAKETILPCRDQWQATVTWAQRHNGTPLAQLTRFIEKVWEHTLRRLPNGRHKEVLARTPLWQHDKRGHSLLKCAALKEVREGAVRALEDNPTWQHLPLPTRPLEAEAIGRKHGQHQTGAVAIRHQ